MKSLASIISIILFFIPISLKANIINDNERTNDTIIIEKTKTIISNGITSVTTKKDTIFDHQPPASEIIADGSNYSFIFQWKKKKYMHPHWNGLGFSFLNYDEDKVPNGSLKRSQSYAISLNLIDYSHTFKGTNFMFVSGVGIDWHRYHFKSNAALTIVDDVTQFLPAPNDVPYKDSKLLAYYFTIPLLLEYQPSRKLHFAGGVVGYIKCYSKSQVKFIDNRGETIKQDMGRDLNIRPVDMKFRLQAGVSDITAFATYSPFSMFDKGDGPELKSYSIGLMYNF